MVDGQIELMIQRAIMKDDSRGVGEPLNEECVLLAPLWCRNRRYVAAWIRPFLLRRFEHFGGGQVKATIVIGRIHLDGSDQQLP